MKNKYLLLLWIVLMLAVTAEAKKKPAGIPINFETQLLGVGTEGTKVIKVWCYGKKVEDAIAEAKRAAVAACLFTGIAGDGVTKADKVPAICKLNDKSTHEAFFIKFFSESGEYRSFINVTTDGSPSGKDRLKMKDGYKVGVSVQVRYDQLREYMEECEIITKMTHGF